MIRKILVKPFNGLSVRHPQHSRDINKDGEELIDSTYLRRRIARGELQIVNSIGESLEQKPSKKSLKDCKPCKQAFQNKEVFSNPIINEKEND